MRRFAGVGLIAGVLLTGIAGCVTRTSDCPVGDQGCACASGDRCFGGLTCTGGICTAPVTPGVDGGGVPAMDSGPAPSTCDACRSDQACVEGACVDPPSMCPCPPETYCDLGAGRCLLGCTSDDGCDPARARICDAATRSCVDGCREDTGCPSGQICEAETCRAGCRDDAGCGAGQICEGAACRAGCRGDTDCPGTTDVCDLGTSTCRTGCRDDAECGIEQICDATAAACVPGCRDETDCHPGRACDGTCTCPTGLTPCGTACVDVTSSTTHCGECDRACSGTATECREGTCTELRPTSGQYADCDADADCTGTATGCFTVRDTAGNVLRGFCTALCGTGADESGCDPVPSGTATRSCIVLDASTSYCGLECTGGLMCPPGMTCTPAPGGAQSFCI